MVILSTPVGAGSPRPFSPGSLPRKSFAGAHPVVCPRGGSAGPPYQRFLFSGVVLTMTVSPGSAQARRLCHQLLAFAKPLEFQRITWSNYLSINLGKTFNKIDEFLPLSAEGLKNLPGCGSATAPFPGRAAGRISGGGFLSLAHWHKEIPEGFQPPDCCGNRPGRSGNEGLPSEAFR